MRRLVPIISLAAIPLPAVSAGGAAGSLGTDNPYVASALVFIVCLVAAAALIGYFGLGRRGRIACAASFGMADFILTGPICLSAGAGPMTSASVAMLSAALLVFAVARYGDRLSSFFRRRRSGSSGYDSERD